MASPTGTPVISPKVVPWITLVVSALAGVQLTLSQTIDHPTLGGKILGGLLMLATPVLGILSPGWRTPAPAGKVDGQ